MTAEQKTEQERARREDFIRGLRDMADFFAQHPTVKLPSTECFNVFVTTREELAEHARVTSWEKVYEGPWFMLRKHFSEDLRLEINTDRQTVCRKVVTGTRVVPAKPAVEEHEEETFEWVCDDASLLAPK